MKKHYQSEEWKRLLRKRELAELKRRRQKRRRKKRARRSTKIKGTVKVTAPTILSIKRAPSDCNTFITDIRQARKARNLVDLDLSPISELTIDGILVLLATVRESRYVRGNYPNDDGAASMLFSSGFFDLMDGTGGSGLSQSKGKIYRRNAKKVSGEAAAELIDTVAGRLPSLDIAVKKSLYRVLIELMANTHEHAGIAAKGARPWYVAATVDKSRKKAYFAFVDTGMGIFESVQIKGLKAAAKAVGLFSNSSLLQEILHGDIASSTGLSYRGKGLPAIYQVAQKSLLSNVVFASNDVFANVNEDRYQSVEPQFSGTLVAWEVNA